MTDAGPGPQDAVPPRFARNAYEEHPPGPAALYEPPAPQPAPVPQPVAIPQPAPGPVAGPPAPSTGWTVTGMPAMGGAPVVPAPAGATPLPFTVPGATPAHGLSGIGGALGSGPRGRILAVEGGYGTSGRRTWGRGGPAQAPVLSAMLAAVSPQVLLAADTVDAVHLPGASDPHTVLAHLRAAARHPGPLLVHLGGHLLADKRGGQLHLTLRDSKPGSIRQDGLAWQSIAGELRHRPAEWQTLVVADLSADQNAWSLLQGDLAPFSEGLPLWAVVSPDPDQIGTFTRALIEALHGGRPGGEAVLAPEQLRHQVYSVLRPDVIVVSTHAPDRPFFRNTARRGEGAPTEFAPYEAPSPAAVLPRPAAPDEVSWDDRPWGESPRDAAVPQDAVPGPRSAVTLDKPSVAAPAAAAPARLPDGPVNLLKPGVPPTPPPPPHPVDLRKAGAWQPPAAEPELVVGAVPEVVPEPEAVAEPEAVEAPESEPTDAAPVGAPPTDAEPEAARPEDATTEEPEAAPASEAAPEPVPAPAPAPERSEPRADYREVIGRIVRSADAGDHAAATDLAFALELEAIAEHGPVSAPVLQVRQVRAHVSRLAGRTAEAAGIYREVALTLLRSEGPEHPETQHAATNAEACWRAIPDREEALRIAPEIIELRAHLPGPDGRKLRAAERHLATLAGPRPDPA
ncbi:hypothetical protein [Kitasatospora purpeofusca]|uniref:hypothetical protein n=1 Tax=Kitasatospora purpeofusca TaxID=67352 RepID=UPI00224CACAC|nr:hypothetical protein [Kitasatospora purpeofusca]MCX4756654.1 hypothetical protein [Kitasatospora purpeofusca]WSR35550.1 hypothetical protein OG715_34065 [Kitasatospora purpeofusca]